MQFTGSIVAMLGLFLFVSLLDAFSAKEGFYWVGPIVYQWWGGQCSDLGSFPDKSLPACKEKCEAVAGCTAVNHNANSGDCNLRRCSLRQGLPVATPESTREGYSGYHLRKVGLVACHTGETLQESNDGTQLCESGSSELESSYWPRHSATWFDKDLPLFENCWDGIRDGKLKQFTFGILLTPGWVSHFQKHEADFDRHGYKSLKKSPGVVLDQVSYLFERQFGVRLAMGEVSVEGEDPEPWADGYAGMIRMDTKGFAYSPDSLCTRSTVLGVDSDPFTEDGELRFNVITVLAHELAHYFGAPHTPAYKPDIMTVDGRPSYRRCNGESCMYRHFLPWAGASSYQTHVCQNNLQKETCSTIINPQGWRIVARKSSSEFAWDVRRVKFLTNEGELLPGSKCRIVTSATACCRGFAGKNAFKDGNKAYWGGRKHLGIFFIGLECDMPEMPITGVTLKQRSINSASHVTVQKLDKFQGWTDVATATQVDTFSEVTLYGSVPESGWRVVASTSSSGWKWDVERVKFLTGEGELSPDSKCHIIQSAAKSKFDSKNAFRDSRKIWRGSKRGDIFYIGLKCAMLDMPITGVMLKQTGRNKASTVKIQKLDPVEGWIDVTSSIPAHPDHMVTIWRSSDRRLTAEDIIMV